MNKRITELMLEAGRTIPGDKHIDADFCERFAELIVQECCALIEREGYKTLPGFVMRLPVPTEVLLIKEYFKDTA